MPMPMKETQKHFAISPASPPPTSAAPTQARKKVMKTKITPREKAETIFHLRSIPRFGVDRLSASGASRGSFLFIKRSVACGEMKSCLTRLTSLLTAALAPITEASLDYHEHKEEGQQGQDYTKEDQNKEDSQNNLPLTTCRPSRTAPDKAGAKQSFKVTHPFHPWFGRRFELIELRRCWGQWRAYYSTEEGLPAYLLASWTDLGPMDPFVEQAKGRAIARVEDLLMLVKMATQPVNQIKP